MGSSKDVAADEGDGVVELLHSEQLESMTERRSTCRSNTAADDVSAIVLNIGERVVN